MNKYINSSRYDEIIEKLSQLVKQYYTVNESKKYSIQLANGDYLNISFPEKSIPHLLGINIDYLKGAGIIKTTEQTMPALKKLLSGQITYYSLKNVDLNRVISEFIDEKTEAFMYNLNPRIDDTVFIIKYSSDRSYTTGMEKENCDYFIIRKHNNKFYVLGIAKADNGKEYLPVTSRLFNNAEDFIEFINKVATNQEITYPTTIQIENYYKQPYKKAYPNIEEKIQFNKTLTMLADQYKAIPSASRDFIITLE